MPEAEVSELGSNPPTLSSRPGTFAEAGNVSVFGGTLTNVAGNMIIHNPNHPQGPNELDPSRSTNSSASLHQTELPSQLYSRLLLREGRGYPLMNPALSNALPDEYQSHGVMIGDVGVISENGQFDILFNICEPADGQINGHCVPEGFETLQKPPDNRYNYQRDRSDEIGGYVISDPIEVTSSPLEESVSHLGEYSYSFQYGSEAGAILALPSGACREDLLHRKDFLAYAVKHGVSWYEFVTQTLGRIVDNGSIYLITGYDKTRSWGTASFFASTRSSNSEICFTQAGWISRGRAHVRKANYLGASSTPPEHQCIFLRGYRVTLGNRFLSKIFGIPLQAETSPMEKVPIHHSQWSLRTLFNIGSGLTTILDNMIGRGSKWANPGTSEGQPGADHPIVTPTPSLSPEIHPSNLINSYLLHKFPQSNLAVTHDSVWCSYLKVKPDPKHENEVMESFFEYIDRSYTTIEENGAIYLVDYPGDKESIVGVDPSDSVKSEQATVVQPLLNAPNIDQNARESDGTMALILASTEGQELAVKLALNTSNVNVNAANSNGYTALTAASSRGHSSIVRLLLDAPGIDVNAATTRGNSALTLATYHGHCLIVQYLLDAPNINVNAKNPNGDTPLHYASSRGHDSIVQLLLNAPGIDINVKDGDGATALNLASDMGHDVIVGLLLNASNIDVNAKDVNGNTALIFASSAGHGSTVELLLHAPGIHADAKNADGATAAYYASSKGHASVVKLLHSVPRINVNA